MMKCGLQDGREDGKRNGVGLMEIFTIFGTRNDFAIGKDPFEKFYCSEAL